MTPLLIIQLPYLKIADLFRLLVIISTAMLASNAYRTLKTSSFSPLRFCFQSKCMSGAATVSGTGMDNIVNICKRKGFIFNSGEIYGGTPGFFDYGPLGVELKNNLKSMWWKDMVHSREDIVGLDSSIVGPSAIWQASGHVGGFSDPMVQCKGSNMRFRADQVFWGALRKESDSSIVCYVCVPESEDMQSVAKQQALKKAKTLQISGPFQDIVLQELASAPADIFPEIPSPVTGQPGQLTQPREFNLMFKTHIGSVSDDSSVGYLRPETAQGIFVNFVNVQRTSRMKIPFGIAQVGKAFRNEISPRNFIFRSREFEQMEIEYFIPPQDDVWKQHFDTWLETSWQWLIKVGLRPEWLGRKEHKDNLAHYAKACTDITFHFPFGEQELMGVAARGNFDLIQHSNASGKSMEYLDPSSNVKYMPHVIEPSLGVDRLFLALLTSCYYEDVVDGEKRAVFKFHPAVAPFKASVLPLLSNKSELTEKAKQVLKGIKSNGINCEYDTSGAIGRRYRRADESGTPFCITIDFQTLQDDTVTVRHRDSMEQNRMNINDIAAFLHTQIHSF